MPIVGRAAFHNRCGLRYALFVFKRRKYSARWNPLPESSTGMACPFLEQQKTPGKVQPAWLPLSGVHVVRLLPGGFTPPALQAAFS